MVFQPMINDDYAKVRTFVYKAHACRIAFIAAYRLTALFFLLFLSILLLCVLFALYPLTILPAILLGAIAVAALISMSILINLFFFRRPGVISTADKIERIAAISHPLIKISLEVSSDKEYSGFHNEIFRRAAIQTRAIGFFSLRRCIPRKKQFTVVVMILLCGSLFLRLYPPELFSYWKLPFTFFTESDVAVSPGTIRVPEKSRVVLQLVDKKGMMPSCMLHIAHMRQGGGGFTQLLRPDSPGVFTTVFDSLEGSINYRFIYGNKRCTPETVTVVPPPFLYDLKVTLIPPVYTGLPIKEVPYDQGGFSAYYGTRALFSVRSQGLLSVVLKSLFDTTPFDVRDSVASGELLIDTSGLYTLMLEDTFRQTTDSAAVLMVGLIPDELPAIRFLRPRTHKNLESAEVETLVVEASDDLGVKQVTLNWCKNGKCDDGIGSLDISPEKPVVLWNKPLIWEIFRFSLYPGDTLFYWASVVDTKTPGTKQTATTEKFWFRVPTFEEMHRAMADRDRRSEELLSQVGKAQDDLMKRVDQLDKSIQRSDEKKWDRQQLAKQIEKEMQSRADSLRAALDDLNETAEKLRKEGALGEEIAKKMEEVQKAVAELVEKYGDTLLFPKEKSGEVTLDAMREAVDKLKQMLPDLAERLDNTLNYLDALRRDRELAMLAMRAEKLAGEQTMLAEAKSEPSIDRHQTTLLDRIDSLQHDIRKSDMSLSEESVSSETTPSLETTMQQVDSTMKMMKNALSQNAMPSKGLRRQMGGSLASLADQLRAQTELFKQQKTEELRSGLLDIVNASLTMVSWQERIVSEASDSEDSRRKRALSQQALREATGLLKNGIDSLPVISPLVKRKLANDVDAAHEAAKATVEEMGSGDGEFGMRIGINALKQVASNALDLLDALDRQSSQDCQGGCGMRESLRRMSGQQSAINAATAQLLQAMMKKRRQGSTTGQMGNGEKDSENSSEEARQEAQNAQKALADELKKLGEKFGDASGEELRKRVEELEKEARVLSRMLNEPREEVTERQDRFLARMLQSALSLHREDEGKEERKSKSSGVVFSKGNESLSDTASGNIGDLFYMLRKKALEKGNYPPSYRASINAYFDSLGVLYLR